MPAIFRKGGRTDRLYKLAPDTLHALASLRHPEHNEIFPWPYCHNYLWQKYQSVLKKAGLPTDRKSKFHKIRRSVASHAKAAGADATELLGHADKKTTNAYIDPRIVETPQAVDYLFRIT